MTETAKPTAKRVDFKEVKERANFRDVLEHYGLRLKEKGKELIGNCPFHEETKASFHVNIEKGVFHCFGCHEKGNVLDFVAKKEGIKIREAAILLSGWSGTSADDQNENRKPAGETKAKSKSEPDSEEEGDISFDNPDAVGSEEDQEVKKKSRINSPLSFTLTVNADHPYLTEERGLSKETIAHFGLGYCNYGIMSGRIAIPIHNENGELIAYAGRWVGAGESHATNESKYRLPQNFLKSLVLFNLHRIPDEVDTVIIVEGFFSVFWLHQCGFDNVVCLMGTSLSERQRELLCSRFKRVMMFFDGDDAGRRASSGVTNELAKYLWVRVIPYLADLQPDKVLPSDLKSLLS